MLKVCLLLHVGYTQTTEFTPKQQIASDRRHATYMSTANSHRTNQIACEYASVRNDQCVPRILGFASISLFVVFQWSYYRLLKCAARELIHWWCTADIPSPICDIRYVARRCSRKIASVAYRLSLSDTFKLDIATSSVWKCCTWFNECYSVSRAHALLVGSWLVHQVSCCLKPNSTKENHNES